MRLFLNIALTIRFDTDTFQKVSSFNLFKLLDLGRYVFNNTKAWDFLRSVTVIQLKRWVITGGMFFLFLLYLDRVLLLLLNRWLRVICKRIICHSIEDFLVIGTFIGRGCVSHSIEDFLVVGTFVGKGCVCHFKENLLVLRTFIRRGWVSHSFLDFFGSLRYDQFRPKKFPLVFERSFELLGRLLLFVSFVIRRN